MFLVRVTSQVDVHQHQHQLCEPKALASGPAGQRLLEQHPTLARSAHFRYAEDVTQNNHDSHIGCHAYLTNQFPQGISTHG